MEHKLIEYIRPVSHTERNIIILGSGPSAIEYRSIPGFATIAVNGAIKLSRYNTKYWFTLDPSMANRKIMIDKPWPAYYYAAVPENYGTPEGDILTHKLERPHGVHYLNRIAHPSNRLGTMPGLAEDPYDIHTGNSAYGALGLAYHMKPKVVILLGVDADVTGRRFDGSKNGNLQHLPTLFSTAVRQLNEAGIRVINGSMRSKIECFPKVPFLDLARGKRSA